MPYYTTCHIGCVYRCIVFNRCENADINSKITSCFQYLFYTTDGTSRNEESCCIEALTFLGR